MCVLFFLPTFNIPLCSCEDLVHPKLCNVIFIIFLGLIGPVDEGVLMWDSSLKSCADSMVIGFLMC